MDDFSWLGAFGGYVAGFFTNLKQALETLEKLVGHIKGMFSRSDSPSAPKIPKQTIRLVPTAHEVSNFWSTCTVSGSPAMQLVGHFNVTNITESDIRLPVARMKRPKLLGEVSIMPAGSRTYGTHPLPPGEMTELVVNLFIQPPIRAEGDPLFADIAIIDQFGNEHWVKHVEFKYS